MRGSACSRGRRVGGRVARTRACVSLLCVCLRACVRACVQGVCCEAAGHPADGPRRPRLQPLVIPPPPPPPHSLTHSLSPSLPSFLPTTHTHSSLRPSVPPLALSLYRPFSLLLLLASNFSPPFTSLSPHVFMYVCMYIRMVMIKLWAKKLGRHSPVSHQV